MWAVRELRLAVKERLPLSVVAHFFVYTAGKIVLSSISVIMAPLMMLLLSPADYGLLSLIHSFNNVAIACLGLGLPQVLMVDYFRSSDSDRSLVINNIIGTYLVSAVPLVVLCALYPHFIYQYLFLPMHQSILIYAILLICLFSFFNDIMFQILQYHRYAVTVTTMQLTVALLTALFNVVSVGYFHWGVASIIWIQFFMVFVVFSVGLFLYCNCQLYKTFHCTNLTGRYAHNLKLGIPFLPSMIVGWLFAMLNRWMVAKYAGMEVAGVFAVADAGGQLFYRFIVYPLQGAYGPALLNSYGSSVRPIKEIERSNHRIMVLVLCSLIMVSFIGYFLFRSMLYWIIPVRYEKAVGCILGILVSYIFLIGSYFVSNFIQFQKKCWIFVAALAVAVLINSVLNLLLIPCYGLSGCIGAMAIAYGSYFCILLIYNRVLLNLLGS